MIRSDSIVHWSFVLDGNSGMSRGGSTTKSIGWADKVLVFSCYAVDCFDGVKTIAYGLFALDVIVEKFWVFLIERPGSLHIGWFPA